MVQISEEVLMELCSKTSIKRESLQFLGGGREDSDGTAYTCELQGEKKVLKILAYPKAKAAGLQNLSIRAEFAYFLGENGIPIACPEKLSNGKLYETVEERDIIFAAYLMNYYEGKNPENKELTDDLVKEWGKLTGKAHKATRNFSLEVSEDVFGAQAEVASFSEWCKDPIVKEVWREMGKTLQKLPKTKDEYGFIHNDNHQRNILVHENKITLIDFDCACRQFFVQDIITPAQGLLFETTGGMICPVYDQKLLDHFFECFLRGYEQEYHLTDFWHDRITLFINYRRMILFTCMQDYVNSQPDLKKGFLQMIQSTRM